MPDPTFLLQRYLLFFYYETGTYDSKTQFYAYGTDEFIADVGGFLVKMSNLMRP